MRLQIVKSDQPETHNLKPETGLLREYAGLLLSFNKSHNLISKHTEADVWKRHIEHCLTLRKRKFPPESTVIDWGTGGGLPAIPLAIVFPDVQFIAVDSTQKKILAVRAMVRKLGLKNVQAWHGRAEEWPGESQYSVSRATAPLELLWKWHLRTSKPAESIEDGDWLPGLICLKGGDLTDEVASLHQKFPTAIVELISIDPIDPPDISAAKYIVHVR